MNFIHDDERDQERKRLSRGLLHMERKLLLRTHAMGFCAIILTSFVRPALAEPAPATMTVVGDWTVSVRYDGKESALNVEPARIDEVRNETHGSMPLYDPNRHWNGGIIPLKTKGKEGFPTWYALDPASILVRSASGNEFVAGKDYELLEPWCVLGRLPGGAITENEPVSIDYRYGEMRLDSVVLDRAGKIVLRKGKPHIVMPRAPEKEEGEILLGNIWITPRLGKLGPNHLFPILETAYPKSYEEADKNVAESLLPKTLKKLRNGETLKILAWGDSVTDGGYLDDPNDRWQEQFVRRLRDRFPNAKIELISEAWGGRTTADFLAQPPGGEHNFQEKVLDPKPDLVVMEFVNDAGLPIEGFQDRFDTIRDRIHGAGAEWIILTPHYIRPQWMGLDRERDIDEDPRPFTQSLRRFAMENRIALADAAKRYGRLWRQGIPFSTLMSNHINHPNKQGMALFADALMALFP